MGRGFPYLAIFTIYFFLVELTLEEIDMGLKEKYAKKELPFESILYGDIESGFVIEIIAGEIP